MAGVTAARCSILDPDDSDDPIEVLAENREKWRSQGIDDYEFVLQRLCFCGLTNPARVVVRDGARLSVTDTTTGEPIPAQFAQYYLTVEELFDFVEDAIDRKAHSIVVEYDATYGFPASIQIDYEQNTVDEEMAFQATSFQPHR
jgi:hypothetical protein